MPGSANAHANAAVAASPNASASAGDSPALGAALNLVLSKLGNIDNRIMAIEAKSTTLKFTLEEIDAKLSPVQLIPNLMELVEALDSRVRIVEERLNTVETEQKNLRAEMLDIGSSKELCDAGNSRVVLMESAVKQLSDTVSNINAQRAMSSAELVISGLTYDDKADLPRLAYAVLHTILPSATPVDVIAVRKMGPSKTAAATVFSGRNPATVAATRSTFKSPQLLVTLSSSTLVRNVVLSKAKRLRKFHSSSLDKELVTAAGVPSTLQSSYIDVNQFLPRDIYILRRSVRAESRINGFISFVRDGQVFVKKTREAVATLISSLDDLKNFTCILPHQQ